MFRNAICCSLGFLLLGVSPSQTRADERQQEATSEFIVRLGNESNEPDGLFGPFTYGVKGSHIFSSGLVIEATGILLHEPGAPVFDALLDEAQVTLRSPKLEVLEQPVTLGWTAWKNRIVDMYTTLGGMEITRPGDLSFTAGVYAGKAGLDEDQGRFFGGLVGVTLTCGAAELGLSNLFGAIRMPGDPDGMGTGRYRKTALEAALDLSTINGLPMTVSFAVEDRYFDFGNMGPRIASEDRLIFVSGLEFKFGL